MQILMFDRLSKTLVVGGLSVVVLGLITAFVRSPRFQNTDGGLFWFCTVITAIGLGLVVWLTRGEAHVRVAGLCFQVVGIVVALYALQDVRAKLDQPGLIQALTAYIEKPFKGQYANSTGEGAVLEGADIVTSEAHATLTTHPKSLSTEDRFTALEDQLAKIEAIHADDIATVKRTIRNNERNELDSHRKQVAAISDVKLLVVELQTGGLPIALFGLIWLFIGAFLSSLPLEVAGWIRRLHH
jgi:hypothetical protein